MKKLMYPLDVRPDGDAVVIEAPTAEEALGEVSSRLGPDARILDAHKVRRGGVAGFFARELVRLTAEAATAPPPADLPGDETGLSSPGGVAPPPGQGLEAVLAGIRQEADGREANFEEILRRRLVAPAAPADADADLPTARDDLPAPTATAPAARDRSAAPGTGGVRWSADDLHRQGLPALVLDACAGLDQDDDLGWVHAVAGAVSSFCRPFPAGSAVLAGPRATRLNETLGLPAAVPDEAPPYGGTVCLKVDGDRRSREWMEWCRGDRWLHLVIGGGRWKALLSDDPLAISWVGADMLPVALSQCAQLGLVLGYGTEGGRGAPVMRATPLDVALAIRRMLPRR